MFEFKSIASVRNSALATAVIKSLCSPARSCGATISIPIPEHKIQTGWELKSATADLLLFERPAKGTLPPHMPPEFHVSEKRPVLQNEFQFWNEGTGDKSVLIVSAGPTVVVDQGADRPFRLGGTDELCAAADDERDMLNSERTIIINALLSYEKRKLIDLLEAMKSS